MSAARELYDLIIAKGELQIAEFARQDLQKLTHEHLDNLILVLKRFVQQVKKPKVEAIIWKNALEDAQAELATRTESFEPEQC